MLFIQDFFFIRLDFVYGIHRIPSVYDRTGGGIMLIVLWFTKEQNRGFETVWNVLRLTLGRFYWNMIHLQDLVL